MIRYLSYTNHYIISYIEYECIQYQIMAYEEEFYYRTINLYKLNSSEQKYDNKNKFHIPSQVN